MRLCQGRKTMPHSDSPLTKTREVPGTRLTLGRDIVGKPRHGLHQALAGAVVLDHPVALGYRRENAPPGHAGPAAQILEDDGLTESHRLDVLAAVVTVDDALGR